MNEGWDKAYALLCICNVVMELQYLILGYFVSYDWNHDTLWTWKTWTQVCV
jgi:hypothetical protein